MKDAQFCCACQVVPFVTGISSECEAKNKCIITTFELLLEFETPTEFGISMCQILSTMCYLTCDLQDGEDSS